jgi:hypothetical protein
VAVRSIDTGFRCAWRNAANIGLNESAIIALWNEAPPDDLIAP